MRVISLNCNGIRSAARKGLFDWLPQQRARVVCFQETKAQEADLAGDELFTPQGWWVHQHPARKKGYAGTAIYSRLEPDEVINCLGNDEFDHEGRYLEARFGKLSVISLYLPSGSSGPERQASKDRFLEYFLPLLKQWRESSREYIICGDWNIAHTKLDLKNWRSNQKNSGFLPHERAWMDQLLDNSENGLGYVDAYRARYPTEEAEGYTWWSNRGNAWANNVGWRIDYQIVSPGLRSAITEAKVYKDSRFSDHAPLIVDYSL